ncbi:MAG: hypothetical protein ACTSYT_05075, partial [Candidatus Asgardarchaeia archaeon]
MSIKRRSERECVVNEATKAIQPQEVKMNDKALRMRRKQLLSKLSVYLQKEISEFYLRREEMIKKRRRAYEEAHRLYQRSNFTCRQIAKMLAEKYSIPANTIYSWLRRKNNTLYFSALSPPRSMIRELYMRRLYS